MRCGWLGEYFACGLVLRSWVGQKGVKSFCAGPTWRFDHPNGVRNRKHSLVYFFFMRDAINTAPVVGPFIIVFLLFRSCGRELIKTEPLVDPGPWDHSPFITPRSISSCSSASPAHPHCATSRPIHPPISSHPNAPTMLHPPDEDTVRLCACAARFRSCCAWT